MWPFKPSKPDPNAPAKCWEVFPVRIVELTHQQTEQIAALWDRDVRENSASSKFMLWSAIEDMAGAGPEYSLELSRKNPTKYIIIVNHRLRVTKYGEWERT